MRVSVAMATRNGERYLAALLESLARQTRPPDELVVHDDASEDATVAIVEEFAARAPFPVRLEAAETRRGHVEAFLRAAELCTGDAIAFCDQDDVWADRKLEICGDLLDRSGAALALHSVRIVDEGLREIAPPWPAIESTRLVPPLGFTGPHLEAPGMAIVFRRSILELADSASRPRSRYGQGRQMLHDEWAVFLAGIAGPIQLVAEPLVLYRQHGANEFGWLERRRRVTLEPVLEDYSVAGEYAADCASFLAAVTVDDPATAARIDAARRRYRVLADRWELRTALYEAPGRRARARLFARLVAAGAYGPRMGGGFGRRAIVKDLVGGIALRTGSTGLGAGR